MEVITEAEGSGGDLMRAIVNCRVCVAIALQALVVTIGRSSLNPITNPNPICSHSIYVTIYFQMCKPYRQYGV
jgi:hypothetical protein